MTEAVLFDLDGTLLDTAKDMLHALRLLAEENNISEIPDYHDGKELITYGSKAIVSSIFGAVSEDRFKVLQSRYLQIYEQNLSINTGFFPGIVKLLNQLHDASIIWGVVTNKPEYLAQPLTETIAKFKESRILISGDTTPHSKPHPFPLLQAASQIGVSPNKTIYVGDALSDIQAAKAAEMKSAVAGWGYIQKGEDPNNWGADFFLNHPNELMDFI